MLCWTSYQLVITMQETRCRCRFKDNLFTSTFLIIWLSARLSARLSQLHYPLTRMLTSNARANFGLWKSLKCRRECDGGCDAPTRWTPIQSRRRRHPIHFVALCETKYSLRLPHLLFSLSTIREAVDVRDVMHHVGVNHRRPDSFGLWTCVLLNDCGETWVDFWLRTKRAVLPSHLLFDFYAELTDRSRALSRPSANSDWLGLRDLIRVRPGLVPNWSNWVCRWRSGRCGPIPQRHALNVVRTVTFPTKQVADGAIPWWLFARVDIIWPSKQNSNNNTA